MPNDTALVPAASRDVADAAVSGLLHAAKDAAGKAVL